MLPFLGNEGELDEGDKVYVRFLLEYYQFLSCKTMTLKTNAVGNLCLKCYNYEQCPFHVEITAAKKGKKSQIRRETFQPIHSYMCKRYAHQSYSDQLDPAPPKMNVHDLKLMFCVSVNDKPCSNAWKFALLVKGILIGQKRKDLVDGNGRISSKKKAYLGSMMHKLFGVVLTERYDSVWKMVEQLLNGPFDDLDKSNSRKFSLFSFYNYYHTRQNEDLKLVKSLEENKELVTKNEKGESVFDCAICGGGINIHTRGITKMPCTKEHFVCECCWHSFVTTITSFYEKPVKRAAALIGGDGTWWAAQILKEKEFDVRR
jgi:hypothetical protein